MLQFKHYVHRLVTNDTLWHITQTAIFQVNHGCAQNPLHTFPRNPLVDGEAANLLRTCCGLVADLLATWPTSTKQVIVMVMEFGK